jgi:hypothetical protein
MMNLKRTTDMRTPLKNKLVVLAAVTGMVTAASAQSGYGFVRPLDNVTAGWHTLLLNSDFMPQMNDDLNDIRIIRINGKDTTEVPYILQNEIPDTVFSKGKLVLIHNARMRFPERLTITENKKRKQTEIEVTLPDHSWIDAVQLYVHDTLAYHRHLTVLAPSVYYRNTQNRRQTETVRMDRIAEDDLEAGKTARYTFSPRFSNRLRLEISNDDNAPLTIDSVRVTGTKQRLMARFPADGNYLVVYGKLNADAPRYDIVNFDVPANAPLLTPGEERMIENPAAPAVAGKDEPLFKNKAWLYTLMGVLILLIGGFSVMMMRRKEEE